MACESRRYPRFRRLVSRALGPLTLVVLVAMSMRMVSDGFDGIPYVPIVVAAMPWLAVVSLVVGLTALVMRRRALAAISALCLLVQLFWHWGFLVPTDRLPATASPAMVSSAAGRIDDGIARIMTLNTHNGLADPEAIVALVREEHVEVLALQELKGGIVRELDDAGLGKVLPHSVVGHVSGDDNGGVNGLWSRAPMSEKTTGLISIEASSVPAGSIDLGGRDVWFGAVHPYSPRPSNRELWGRGLDEISRLGHDGRTYVLMGDFNSSWDHPSFRALLGDRFVDAGQRAGEGFHMTYPADRTFLGLSLPPLVEIDHIVHDRDVIVGDLETRRVLGSDHMALLATVAVR